MVAAFYALPVRASDPRTNIVRQRVPVRAGPPAGRRLHARCNRAMPSDGLAGSPCDAAYP